MSNVGGIAGEQLRSFVERIERVACERDALTGDIRDIYAEAKSAGFDVKIIRLLIAERKLDHTDLAERESLLELYRRALGDYQTTPLGDAALRSVA